MRAFLRRSACQNRRRSRRKLGAFDDRDALRRAVQVCFSALVWPFGVQANAGRRLVDISRADVRLSVLRRSCCIRWSCCTRPVL